MCSAFAESAQGAVKDGQQGCSSKGRKQERAQRERRARYALKPAPPFTLMLRLGRSQGSCPKGPRKSYLPGRGDTMITKDDTQIREALHILRRLTRAQHVPAPAMCSAFAESAQGAVKDGQQGCSSKGRKQERAQRERRARYALKPAPPFTLMLRLGRSQGSCPKGPRKSYLPGRGDTMITKVVHPG
ncbi:hypothetical protein SRHO_G00346180 [Serrasalmus rhombeus]